METFKKYPSLINVEHKKDIEWWIEHYPQLKSESFRVREKLDGANLQILFYPDGREKRVGRRTDWLVAGEPFYNYKQAMQDCDDLIVALQALAIDRGWPIRAYLELYGVGINRRVKYGNAGLKLALLDMAFAGVEADNMWSHSQLENWAFDNKVDVYLPPDFGVFDIDDAINFDLNFNSKVLNIDNNQAEGVVISPLSRPYYNARGERFVLKAKHPDFGEMDRKAVWKPRDPATPEQQMFLQYLNDNRVLSVFSKHGPMQNIRQLGDYIKLVMEDAKEDFKREHPEVDTFDKNIFSRGGNEVAKLLRKYL